MCCVMCVYSTCLHWLHTFAGKYRVRYKEDGLERWLLPHQVQQPQQADVGDVQSSVSEVHESQQLQQVDVGDVQSSFSKVHEVQQPLQADVGDVHSSVSEVHESQQPCTDVAQPSVSQHLIIACGMQFMAVSYIMSCHFVMFVCSEECSSVVVQMLMVSKENVT